MLTVGSISEVVTLVMNVSVDTLSVLTLHDVVTFISGDVRVRVDAAEVIRVAIGQSVGNTRRMGSRE